MKFLLSKTNPQHRDQPLIFSSVFFQRIVEKEMKMLNPFFILFNN
jgi:hypothetical protein